MPHARSAALLAAGTLLLTACSDSGSTEAEAAVTLKNCGHTVSVDSPPERAVSLNQGRPHGGYGDLDRPRAEGVGEGEREGPEDRRQRPLLRAGPGVRPRLRRRLREQFDKLGVPTYVSPSDCTGKDNSGDGDGARSEALGIDTVYGEVRDLAEVFGVEDRAEKLVASPKARMTKATSDLDASDVTLLYWFANSESPYLAGCCGAPGIITRTLTRKSQTAGSAAKKIAFLDLLNLIAGLPVTTVVALHDLNLAAMYCDHVVVLHTGRVHACGAPGDVLTEELIAEVYGVRAAVTREGTDGRPHVRFLGTLV